MFRRAISMYSALATVMISTTALADNVCDAVLTNKAFNVYDSTTLDNLADKATHDTCSTHWSSKDDFTDRVRKWDSSFDYAKIFSGTGNLDVSQSNRTIDQDYSQ